jgi:hypothetical protein
VPIRRTSFSMEIALYEAMVYVLFVGLDAK